MGRFRKDIKKIAREPRVSDVNLQSVTSPAIPLSVLTEREEGEIEKSPEVLDLTQEPSSDKEEEEEQRLEEQVKEELLDVQIKEEKREPRESWSPKSSGSAKRLQREESSPDNQPERKTRKSECWERLNKETNYYVLTACQNNKETTASKEEVGLVDWHHEIGEDIKLHTLSLENKKQYIKVFKIWRQSKHLKRHVNEDLVRSFNLSETQRENMKTSWEAFLKKCATTGDIETDIDRRTRGKEGNSLTLCRRKVHDECSKTESTIPCYVRYKEGECHQCNDLYEGLGDSRQTEIMSFPKRSEWDDDQFEAISRYDSALRTFRYASERRRQFNSPSKNEERYTRQEYQEHPDSTRSIVPMYPGPEGNLPIEPGRLRRGDAHASYDREESDWERYSPYDQRSQRAAFSRQYGGQRSYRPSTTYHQESPRVGMDRDDRGTREPRYFSYDEPTTGSLSSRIDRVKDDLYHQSLEEMNAREKVRQRVSEVERSVFGLTDKTSNLEKKMDGYREHLKKMTHEQKTELARLKLIVDGTKHDPARLLEHDRVLKTLQEKLEQTTQQLMTALKRIESQSEVIEKLVSRVYSEKGTKEMDQKASDQEEKGDMP